MEDKLPAEITYAAKNKYLTNIFDDCKSFLDTILIMNYLIPILIVVCFYLPCVMSTVMIK